MTTVSNRIGHGTAFALLAAAVALAATPSLAASAVLASTSTMAGPHYDGLWSVSVVTEKGTCDRGYRYPIRISNGVLVNAGSAAFTITGKVAPSGSIVVTVSHGSSSATGFGRLAGDLGGGTWSGGECSGTWTAERRNSMQIN